MVDLLGAAEEKIEHATKEAEKKAWQTIYGSALAYYTVNLLRHDELNEAQAWQAKLEKLEPDTARSFEVKARLLAKQKNGAAAVALLQKLADRDAKLVHPIAAALEEIGQPAAARLMFERFAAEAKEPERLLTLAVFLGRQDLPREGLDVCDRAWKTCPAEAVGNACVAVVYTAKSGESHYQRVAIRLEQAILDYPDKPGLLTGLAAVRRLQGRNEDALKLLQQAGSRDRNDSLVQNNIAWLLVFAGKTDEAMKAIESAITLRGEQSNLLDTRAVIYIAKGRYNDAVRDLETAIAERPTAHRYFHLAQAHHAAKNQTAALDAIHRGKALGLTETSVDPLERPAYQTLMRLEK
jgi:tetratricopeptide (TPR) repeat protein